MNGSEGLIPQQPTDRPRTPKDSGRNGGRFASLDQRLRDLEERMRDVELIKARDEGRQDEAEARKAKRQKFWRVAFGILQALGIASAIVFAVLAYLATRGGEGAPVDRPDSEEVSSAYHSSPRTGPHRYS